MIGRSDTPQEEDTARPKGFDDFDLLLGDIMRGERATLGKSLLDVQRELKIKATYIAAIENTDPSAFDTPGFVAGYVRSYARYLGLDPEWAFKTFCDEGNFTVAHGMSADASSQRKTSAKRKSGAKTSGKATGQPKPAHLRDPFTEPSVSYMPAGEAMFTGVEPRAIGSVAILIALIAGIGYGGWSVLQEVQKVQFAPVEQTPGVLSQLDPLAPTGAVETASEIETAEFTAPPTLDSFDRLYRPEALEVPVMVARDGPIASIDPTTVGSFPGLPDDSRVIAGLSGPDTLPFAIPGSLPVSEAPLPAVDSENLLPPVQVIANASPGVFLLAVRPSWVRVQSGDGTIIFEKILDAGEEFEIPQTETAPVLRAGNAGSLYFSVNGQTYGPAGSGPAVIKNVSLSPDALTETYAVADVAGDTDLARFIAVAQAEIDTGAAAD